MDGGAANELAGIQSGVQLRGFVTLNSSDGVYYNAALKTVVIYKDGANLSGIDFRGVTVNVQANNVTISNSSFDSSAGYFSIHGYPGYQNLVVTHSSFDGLKADSNYLDFINARGENTVIKDNVFLNAPNDAIYISSGTVSGNNIVGGGYATGAHSDAIWVSNTNGPLLIENNYIDWRTPSDATVETNNAIRITGELGNVSGVTIRDNTLLGGSFTVFVSQGGAAENQIGTVSGVSVTGNTIDAGMYGPLYTGARPADLVYSGNVGLTPIYHPGAESVATSIDLGALHQITGSSAADALAGTSGADYISGGAAQDWISAGAGDDVIEGGSGRDYLFGGAGRDVFLYRNISDSFSGGAGADLISDFVQGEDRISLAGLAAAPATAQGWSWLGSERFTGDAWQLRYSYVGGNTLIELDIDGDMKADFNLQVAGNVALKPADFILAAAVSATASSSADPVAQPTQPAPVEAAPSKPVDVVVPPVSIPALLLVEGTAGADVLIGGSGAEKIVGGAGNDSIRGGGGDDIIVGGLGKDILFGGAGHDQFVYTSAAESAAGGGTRDYIGDFTVGEDIIDLSQFDANPLSAAIDPFKWLGTAGFTGQAGELRYVWQGDKSTIVQADLDGDKKADFEVELAGAYTPNLSDFKGVVAGSSSTGNTGSLPSENLIKGVLDSNTLAGTGGIDRIIGGIGNDSIRAGAGDDVIIGGRGKDILFGGAGNDRFVYESVEDSKAGSLRDYIGDFEVGHDIIDLSALNGASASHLAWAGQSSFSGRAGEVRMDWRGTTSTIVQADINGDGKADLEIELAGRLSLTATDFHL